MNLPSNIKNLIKKEKLWYSLRSDFFDNDFSLNSQTLQEIKSQKIVSVKLVEYLLEVLPICLQNHLPEDMSEEITSLIESQISEIKYLPIDLINDAIQLANQFLDSIEFLSIIDIIWRRNKNYHKELVVEYLNSIITSENADLQEKCLDTIYHINTELDKLPNNLVLTLISHMDLENQGNILQILKYKKHDSLNDPRIDQALSSKLDVNGLEKTILEYIQSTTINGMILADMLVDKLTDLIHTRFDLVDHIFKIFINLHKTAVQAKKECAYTNLVILIDKFQDLSSQNEEDFCANHTKLLREIELITCDFEFVPIKLVQALINVSDRLLSENFNKCENLASKSLNLYKNIVIESRNNQGMIQW